MKKSELRQLIREEISNIQEESPKKSKNKYIIPDKEYDDDYTIDLNYDEEDLEDEELEDIINSMNAGEDVDNRYEEWINTARSRRLNKK